MKRILAVLMATALTLGLAGGALAETDDSLTSTSVFAPDSPLFFIQHVLDAWEEFLAFDPLDKARLHAKVADNRLAETAAMLKAKREDIAERLSAQVAERLERAAAALAQAKADADRDTDRAKAEAKQQAIDDVLARLAKNAERQQSVLAGVLEKVTNEKAKEAIENAMERSSFGLENAIRNVGGEHAPAMPPGKPTDAGSRPVAPASGRPAAPSGRPAVPAPTR